MIFYQQTYMANERNKQKLIKQLMGRLSEHGFLSFQADGEDIDIVSHGIESASKQQLTVSIIAEGTDILVMLSCNSSSNMADVWLAWMAPWCVNNYPVTSKCSQSTTIQRTFPYPNT
jgi:sucrose-6-phosphate hydrolase SacC (GH32 family)